MFKKRIARNLRTKRDDSDNENGRSSDENEGSKHSENVESESIEKSAQKVVEESKKIVGSASVASLLSFADEDNESHEVFKVKKSNQSKKLEKMRQRGKGDDRTSTKSTAVKFLGNVSTSVGKKLDSDTNTVKSSEEKRKVEQDLILVGRDAETFGPSEDEAECFMKKLGSNEIPDAKLIHMARKQRQLARDAAEFQPLAASSSSPPPPPLDDTQRYRSSGAKSRLVREDDENSAEDSGEETGRFYSKLSNEQDEERRRVETDFLIREQGSEEENDDEFDKWEREQIRKGVSVQQLTSYKQEQIATAFYYSQQQAYGSYATAPYLDPFLYSKTSSIDGSTFGQCYSSITADSTSHDQSHGHALGPISDVQDVAEPQPMDLDIELPPSDELPSEFSTSKAVPTADEGTQSRAPKIGGGVNSCQTKRLNFDILKDRINERHRENESLVKNLSFDLETHQRHFDENLENIEKFQQGQPELEQKLAFYQEMRSFVRDLLDCFDEKIPLIERLEERAVILFSGRTNFTSKRRQLDVKDQFDEISMVALGKMHANDPDRMMRSSEREARRARRRQAREKSLAGLAHHDGMSSDDEEAPSRIVNFNSELEKLALDSGEIFSDVIDEYCSVEKIVERFEHWKMKDSQSYNEAYGNLCLPKLLAPIIRVQTLVWNLADPNASGSLENFAWIKFCSKMISDQRDQISGDDRSTKLNESDQKPLAAWVIEKVMCHKLKEFIVKIWDPTSSCQCQKLSQFIKTFSNAYPIAEDKIFELHDLIHKRIKLSLDDDLFTPIYSKEVVENKVNGAYVFLDRQFWFALKFMKNLTFWEKILPPKILQELTLDGILNRHLVLNLQCSLATESSTLLKCKSICNTITSANWFCANKKNDSTPQLEPFLKIMSRICEQIRDNKRLDRSESNDMLKEICRLCLKLRDTKYSGRIMDKFRIRI